MYRSLNPTRYLDALARRPHRYPRHAGRSGLHALLESAGLPQRRLRVVHIAGSKGKGSSALMLESLLRAAGCSTGVFLSPHLQRWNERIRIDGSEVDDATLAAVLQILQPRIAALHRRDDINGPSFFEVLLVAALRLFADAGVDQAVIEAGVGARFDATAVVEPAVAAITSVEREHVEFLGPHLRDIAYDKAGVARPGVPLVLGRVPPVARAEIERVARGVGAPVFRAGAAYHLRLAREDQARVLYRDDCYRIDVPLPARSRALAQCAGVALACARHLTCVTDLPAAAALAFDRLELPGRLEILVREPLVIADAAHTRASIAALRQFLCPRIRGRLVLVLSASAGRDLSRLAAPLLQLADCVIVTQPHSGRSAEPAVLARGIAARGLVATVRVVPDPAAALAMAFADLSLADTLCATGSAYMAGYARSYFRTPAAAG